MTAREKFMALARKQAYNRRRRELYAKTHPQKPKAPKEPKPPRRPVQQPIPEGYGSHHQIATMFQCSASAVTQAVRRGHVLSRPWGRYAIIAIDDWKAYQARVAINRKASAYKAQEARIAKAKERYRGRLCGQ